MREADWLIDVGLGRCFGGEEIVAAGTPEQIASKKSITGRRIYGQTARNSSAIGAPHEKQPIYRSHNCERAQFTVSRPASLCVKFIAVTGVSNSGKSSG